MKSRRALEKQFDSLYAQAERILKKYNPCQHKMENGKHSCLGKKHRVWEARSYNRDRVVISCCCLGCKFWVKDKGCTANKPLSCKVWLCGIAEKLNPVVAKKLNALSQKVICAGFYVFRGDKNDSINGALRFQNSNATVSEKKAIASRFCKVD